MDAWMGEMGKVLKNKVLLWIVKNLSMFGNDRKSKIIKIIIKSKYNHIILYMKKYNRNILTRADWVW